MASKLQWPHTTSMQCILLLLIAIVSVALIRKVAQYDVFTIDGTYDTTHHVNDMSSSMGLEPMPQATDRADAVLQSKLRNLADGFANGRTEAYELGSYWKKSVVPPLRSVGDINELVTFWFSAVPDNSVTLETLLRCPRCHFFAVIGSKLYRQQRRTHPSFLAGRLDDLAVLLEMALKEYRIPDVLFLVCPFDGGPWLYQNQTHPWAFRGVKVLHFGAYSHGPGSLGVPMPMLARGRRPVWPQRFSKQENWSAILERTSDWNKKKNTAFFRGRAVDLTGTSGKLWSKCADIFSVFDNNLTRVAEIMLDPPEESFFLRSPCLRWGLLERFCHAPPLDICGSNVPQRAFYDNKVVMILGNSMGWADRTSKMLQEPSIVVYIDQTAYEWYMPLLEDMKTVAFAPPVVPDLIRKARLLLSNASNARRLAEQQMYFASWLFSSNVVIEYVAKSLIEYARKQAFAPEAVLAAADASQSSLQFKDIDRLQSGIDKDVLAFFKLTEAEVLANLVKS
eukprot:TRINITY_DN18662_c0_g1_i1.p1 TRINITY_DN18662_c0_g1~~TRINITY_DN18662_c0_g1_i1.p1  ORF type:complete len:508 (-),score=28.60 TRINITY_DN18662_c0_g1_i1:112-1635(-)